MLRKLSLALILSTQLVVSTVSFAGIKPVQANGNLRYDANPVYIHNNTNSDLAYRVHGSTMFNNVYGVLNNSYDTYHAGDGDDHAFIEIAHCNRFQFPDKCPEHAELSSCVNAFYNIYGVSDIYIGPDMHCSIKCRDGSATNCRN